MTRQHSLISTALGLLLLAGATAAPAQGDGMNREPSTITAEERALSRYHAGERALDAGDLSRAATKFREALSLDRELLSARRSYARILMVTRRPERAQDVLLEGLALAPGDLPTARMLARIARANNDADTAIKALESVRPPADSSETHLRSHLADLYRRTEQYDQAANLYAELRRAEPDATAWILGEAICHDRRGAVESAHDAWGALLEVETLDERIRTYASQRQAALRNSTLSDRG
jgi:MSHA biogenesis protein MshN